MPPQAEPTHAEHDVVDVIFFPTGGGKTEAYLGLAAFTLVLRRLRNAGHGSACVAVLIRYTLRLLTLDQVGRAAPPVCMRSVVVMRTSMAGMPTVAATRRGLRD